MGPSMPVSRPGGEIRFTTPPRMRGRLRGWFVPAPLPRPSLPGYASLPMPGAAPPTVDPARRGRRIALSIFYAVVVGTVAVWTAQITTQVFASRPGRDSGDCRSGLASLAVALDSARSATEHVEASQEDAIAGFRAALSPGWDDHDRIAATCAREGDPRLLQALDTVERLRYAEENSIRRDARDLGLLRRRMRALRESLFGAP